MDDRQTPLRPPLKEPKVTTADVADSTSDSAELAPIEITGYKPINKNSLVGVFDVSIPCGIVIHGAMLLRKGKAEWVALPGIPYEENAKKLYKLVVEIPDRATRQTFSAEVIAALKEGGHV